jgi:hypothetical protein
MWHDVVDTGGCSSANEFDEDRNRQLGHRRNVGEARVLPRQDVRSRRRSSSREPLAKWIRAWGSAEPATGRSASWHVEGGTLACSRVGWSRSRAICNRVALVGIAAYRMPVRNFMRWGQELQER